MKRVKVKAHKRGIPEWIKEGYEEEDWEEHKAICLECKKDFYLDTDIQLCQNCMKKFNVDKLWKLHDKGELDALDFNENITMREKFRKR